MIRIIHLFHKYGIAMLYLFVYFTFYLSGSDFYYNNAEYISQTLSVGLYMCAHLFAAAIVYKKCVWQKGCIVGLAAYCAINVLHEAGYIINYYENAQLYSFIVAIFFVSTYIYLEEIKGINYTKKRYK